MQGRCRRRASSGPGCPSSFARPGDDGRAAPLPGLPRADAAPADRLLPLLRLAGTARRRDGTDGDVRRLRRDRRCVLPVRRRDRGRPRLAVGGVPADAAGRPGRPARGPARSRPRSSPARAAGAPRRHRGRRRAAPRSPVPAGRAWPLALLAGTVPFALPRDRARLLGAAEGRAADREPALPRARLRRRALDPAVEPAARRRGASPASCRRGRSPMRSSRPRSGSASTGLAGSLSPSSRRSSPSLRSPATGATKGGGSRDLPGAFDARRRRLPYTSTHLGALGRALRRAGPPQDPGRSTSGWVLWWAIKAEPELGTEGGTESVNWRPWRPPSPATQPGRPSAAARTALATVSPVRAPAPPGACG